MSLPLPEVQEMLASSTEKIEEAVSAVEGKLSVVREEMEQLKVQLYARFGKSINLETWAFGFWMIEPRRPRNSIDLIGSWF